MLHFLFRVMAERLAGGRPLPRILQRQRARLQRLVACARDRSPFYAERYRHINSHDFRLADLPVVTKADMMGDFDRFLTDRVVKRSEVEQFMSDPARLGEWYLGRYAVSRTSGTQGLQAIIVQDRRAMETTFALQLGRGSAFPATPANIVRRLFKPARLAVVTIGRGFYPSAAGLAYAPPAALRFMERLWISHIEPLGEVVDRLNAFGPDILLAYANVLEILAREVLAGRLRLGPVGRPLRQVINMSEPLSHGARRLIERAFGVPVTNNYATGECMHLTVGCARGGGMHLQADWAVLEVVDAEGRPVEPGTAGARVLVTNLANFVQPFIRYEVPDAVTMSPTPCPCGSALPLVRDVEGRADEVVWVRDGDRFRQIHPYVFVDALDDCPAIGWYQIEQTERNRFRLKASPAPGRPLSAEEVKHVLRGGLERFGLSRIIDFDVEITERVAPDPRSGKLRRITSLIGPPPEMARLEQDPANHVA